MILQSRQSGASKLSNHYPIRCLLPSGIGHIGFGDLSPCPSCRPDQGVPDSSNTYRQLPCVWRPTRSAECIALRCRDFSWSPGLEWSGPFVCRTLDLIARCLRFGELTKTQLLSSHQSRPPSRTSSLRPTRWRWGCRSSTCSRIRLLRNQCAA